MSNYTTLDKIICRIYLFVIGCNTLEKLVARVNTYDVLMRTPGISASGYTHYKNKRNWLIKIYSILYPDV
jgi:hypothetical protein